MTAYFCSVNKSDYVDLSSDLGNIKGLSYECARSFLYKCLTKIADFLKIVNRFYSLWSMYMERHVHYKQYALRN